jgi:dethiobiotin synthetase
MPRSNVRAGRASRLAANLCDGTLSLMTRKPLAGLFITGTDTNVGKTHVGAAIARSLLAAGWRVGVYKPAASGCLRREGELVSEDALALWEAAGRPGELEAVCPQRFEAPLAPHLAAEAEGRQLDARRLRSGLEYWLQRSQIVLVEGAGGLMSPMGFDEYVADLAYDFGLPMVVVARNQLGVINQVLQTLIVAATFRHGLPVAGVVLNNATAATDDPSRSANRREIERHAVAPVLGEFGFQAESFEPAIDWFALADRFTDSRLSTPRHSSAEPPQ